MIPKDRRGRGIEEFCPILNLTAHNFSRSIAIPCSILDPRFPQSARNSAQLRARYNRLIS